MIKNVEADLQKLLGVTIGDLRARLAYVDADINVEEWLEDFGGLNDLVIDEERDILDDYEEDFEDEDFDPEEIDDDIYPVLRGEIVEQAAKYGITEDELKFWWD